MLKSFFKLSFLFIAIACIGNDDHYLSVGDNREYTNINEYLYILPDHDSLTIEEVKSRENRLKFKAFGDITIENKDDYWCKFTLRNESDYDTECVLYLTHSLVVDLYIPNEEGYRKKRSGQLHPISTDEIAHNITPKFLIRIPAKEKMTFYAHSSNKGLNYPHSFNLKLEDTHLFHNFVQKDRFTSGIFLGILLILGFYNIFLYLFYWNRTYIYYCLYLLFIGINFIGYKGIYLFLFGDQTYPDQFTTIGLGVYIFYMLFVRKFTEIDKKSKLFRKAFWIFILIDTLLYVYVCFLPYLHLNGIVGTSRFAFWYIDLNLLATLFITLYLIYENPNRYRFIIIGSSAMLVGFFMASQLKIINAGLIGVIVEICFFSIALGFKFNKSELERQRMQKRLMEQNLLNYQLKKKSQENIDRLINERIKELGENNELFETRNKEIIAKEKYRSLFKETLDKSYGTFDKDFLKSVVFFRPVKLEGGDFYWGYQLGDVYLIALFDVQKHKLSPKEFLRIISNEYIDRLIREEKTLNLEKFTRRLHEEFNTIFQSNEVQTSFCSINLKSKKLHFSGSCDRFIYFQDDQIRDLKTTKQTLENESQLAIHEVELSSETFLYMMTDGYFSNRNQQVKWNNFLNLLINTHEKAAEEQRQVFENHYTEITADEAWQEDVLLIGVRIPSI